MHTYLQLWMAPLQCHPAYTQHTYNVTTGMLCIHKSDGGASDFNFRHYFHWSVILVWPTCHREFADYHADSDVVLKAKFVIFFVWPWSWPRDLWPWSWPRDLWPWSWPRDLWPWSWPRDLWPWLHYNFWHHPQTQGQTTTATVKLKVIGIVNYM